MSCFPEPTYAGYADGELADGERRAVEAHLVGCRRCRELVMALRDEDTALREALHEREPEPQRADALAPARGIAVGGFPALGAAASAVLGFGWLLDALRPRTLDWLGITSLRGAYDMAFDLIFLLRDRAPAVFEVGLAVAAMASASALLTFALTVLMRRVSGPTLSALVLLFVLAPTPEARAHFGLHDETEFQLGADEVHDGTLVVSARTVNVDGRVLGDLIALGERLVVRGVVEGNVFAVARSIEIPGEVLGSLHLGTRDATVEGLVRGNLYALAEDLRLAPGARVERDTALVGETAVIEGRVGRDLSAGVETLELRGEVARGVRAWAERLSLLAGSRVGRDVDAFLPSGVAVEQASGSRVEGDVNSHLQEYRPGRRGLARYAGAAFWMLMALHVAAGFATAMLLRVLLPVAFGGRVETGADFFRNLGVGFLVLVAAPFALLLAGLTVVGLPAALIGLALFLAALYVAHLVVAQLVGSALVRPRDESWGAFGLALLVGLVVVVLLVHAPWLGGLVRALVVLTGLGLLAQTAHRGWRATRG